MYCNIEIPFKKVDKYLYNIQMFLNHTHSSPTLPAPLIGTAREEGET
jgi:hypothetical protein